MSYFGKELKKAIMEAGLTQQGIARGAGLFDAQISRLINGKQIFIEPENLAKICKMFEKDPRTGESTPLRQASLIAAHCMDHRNGPGSQFVKISLDAPFGETPAKQVELSPQTERAFTYIRQTIHAQKQFEKFIIQLAEMMGMK